MYVTIIPLIILLCSSLSEKIYIYDHLGLNFIFSIMLFVPVASVLFFQLYWYLKGRVNEEKTEPILLKDYLDVIFIISFSFFLTGYTIHFVGNDLNNLLNEQVELAYLYDEIIGHVMAYFGAICMFFIFVYLQYKAPLDEKIPLHDTGALLLLGVFFGLFSAYGVIEGQTPYLGYAFDPIFAVAMYWLIHRKSIDFRRVPMILFITVAAVVTFIIMIVYGIYFWGWPQPSELLR